MAVNAPTQANPRDLLKAAQLSDQVGFLLRFAQAAVWSDVVAAFEPLGLRPVHYSILKITKAVPGSRQQAIGEALSIQRPNVVALIDDLQERGLIQRKRHPQDRRSHALYLTPEGTRCLDDMERAHAAHVKRISELLSPAERRGLIVGLKRLASLRYNLFS
jgi:DNA-binding MarR family transcriptional regulator